MGRTGSGPLWTYALMAALIGFSLYRRTRPQPVRPNMAVGLTAIIVLLSGLGLLSGAASHPIALYLAPIALAGGFALGWVMMRTITFWRDDTTGELWMHGGLLYVLIWLATFLLRTVVGTLAGAPPGSTSIPADNDGGPLAILATDLLVVSMGLWIARAAALVYHARRVPAVAPAAPAEPHDIIDT